MIRIVSHHDWVIYCIIGIIFSYIILFKTLRRDISVIDFITQSFDDSNNNTFSWFITTLLFSLSFSVLFSQYIPIVPKYITENTRFIGIELNKFGFLFLSLLFFYFLKNLVIYFFYGSIQQLRKFSAYSFVTQKYYLVYSFVILIISLLHYYVPFSTQISFHYYMIMVSVAFMLKILIYLFHNQQILPDEWYYKFLYICTLQILPALVIWKFWFL